MYRERDYIYNVYLERRHLYCEIELYTLSLVRSLLVHPLPVTPSDHL
jgi:hypothetical protein